MVSISKCDGDMEHSKSGEKKPLIPVRVLQCFLLFLGISISYTLRFNLSISMVAMTDRNATNVDADVYNWNEQKKSYIFSSFFWGYTITQIPGGYFSNKFGPKRPIFIGVLCSSLLGFLTPICAKIGDWPLIVALRVLQGLFQGLIFPSVQQFVSKWTPADERAMLAAFVYAGAHFGMTFSYTTGGFIAASPLGWPSNFYLSGLLGITWSVIWYLFSANSPSEHKSITDYEKQIISVGNEQKTADIGDGAPLKPPWGKILTSVPFYAALITISCNAFGFTALIVEMPIYIHNILHFNIKSNGPLSAMPYFASLCMSFLFIYINGVITRRHWLSLNASRKVFNTFGLWTAMIALTVMGYLTTGESRNWAILLLVLAVSLNTAWFLGAFVNPIDLSPNFAGPLMGVLNFGGNVVGLIAPLVVGVVVTDEKNPDQWRIVFFIAAAFYLVGSLSFIFFAKTNAQPWNDLKEKVKESQS